MKRSFVPLAAALTCVVVSQTHAQLITNGGFESGPGLSGWTTLNQVGSEGTFAPQTGTVSPDPGNAFVVPVPPEGAAAAMSDAMGGGSRLLYQDFVVPVSVPGASVGFSLYINNDHGAEAFFSPAHLDWATPALNQQARVDIVTASADPFSVAPGDVLQNLYQSNPGDSLVSGYNNLLIDITSLLQAHPGETLRLRFAAVDNVAPFNVGVDNVRIAVVPEPSACLLVAAGAMGLTRLRRLGGRMM